MVRSNFFFFGINGHFDPKLLRSLVSLRTAKRETSIKDQNSKKKNGAYVITAKFGLHRKACRLLKKQKRWSISNFMTMIFEFNVLKDEEP